MTGAVLIFFLPKPEAYLNLIESGHLFSKPTIPFNLGMEISHPLFIP